MSKKFLLLVFSSFTTSMDDDTEPADEEGKKYTQFLRLVQWRKNTTQLMERRNETETWRWKNFIRKHFFFIARDVDRIGRVELRKASCGVSAKTTIIKELVREPERCCWRVFVCLLFFSFQHWLVVSPVRCWMFASTFTTEKKSVLLQSAGWNNWKKFNVARWRSFSFSWNSKPPLYCLSLFGAHITNKRAKCN